MNRTAKVAVLVVAVSCLLSLSLVFASSDDPLLAALREVVALLEKTNGLLSFQNELLEQQVALLQEQNALLRVLIANQKAIPPKFNQSNPIHEPVDLWSSLDIDCPEKVKEWQGFNVTIKNISGETLFFRLFFPTCFHFGGYISPKEEEDYNLPPLDIVLPVGGSLTITLYAPSIGESSRTFTIIFQVRESYLGPWGPSPDIWYANIDYYITVFGGVPPP